MIPSIINQLKDTQSVSKNNIFSTLRKDELEDLFSSIQITNSIFQKDEILAMQDEPCNRLMVLLKGSVRAEMADPTGKVVKVEDVVAPSPLAILFLFGSENKFPVQVTANTQVSVLIIPRQSVVKMLGMNEKLLSNYLDISANYATKLSKKLHLMSFRTIRQKLTLYLLDLSKQTGATVTLDRSQAALAEYFGVSRPSLTRELHNMQTDKLITINKKEIVIIDKHKLIQLISFQ